MNAVQKRKITQFQSSYVEQLEKQELKYRQRRKGLVRRLTVFMLIVGVVSYLLISTIVSQSKKLEEQSHSEQNLKKQLTQLENKQQQLEAEVIKLNDDEYIANILRRDYFLSKDGEIIFKINDESSSY